MERSSACAVSSSVNPPKKRSSMILHLRSSTSASAVQRVVEGDHSGAALRREAEGFVEGSFGAPPPRFCAVVLGARDPPGSAASDARRRRRNARGSASRAAFANQPQIGFVDQRGGLQGGRRHARREDSARPDGASRRTRAGPTGSSPPGCRFPFDQEPGYAGLNRHSSPPIHSRFDSYCCTTLTFSASAPAAPPDRLFVGSSKSVS